ncbi:UNKNOWN [Stylonychia lemnae]|uniref:Uncharacterized protein n=1 Tax=Stylonychia lemnae TaxID=5949 RepID=A0A078A1A5_STYLE|nr:UNKNOWN [Stylonychia lemnae]|eukprot:CDW75865.1 UNKNOWN [Stylonychia lemnae]
MSNQLNQSQHNNIQSSLNEKGEHWNEVEKTKFQLEDIITDLDKKLNRVLLKQEYDYLKGYNIYVKRKEKELRELIDKLNEKNSNNTLKDEKINNLEKTIHAIREDQIKQEKEKEALNEKVKYWKTKALGYEQEKDFLQNQIMDAKRQNKLLKLAIGRLQNELEKKDYTDQNELSILQGEGGVKVFLTENQNQAPEMLKDLMGESARVHKRVTHHEKSQFVDGTTAPTSILEAGVSKLSGDPRLASNQQVKRVMTRSPISKYRHIQTENIKFSKFLDLLFKSKMTKDDIKDEIAKYVQALETNYNDTIKEMRMQIEREKNKLRRYQSDKVNNNAEKNDLESLFVDCIEEVRKDIMKRRLKNEIYNKKKFQQIEKNSEEAKEFEESLLRLAQLAKNRIKITDFTIRDKCNLLDLFVNNEKTLLKIYEALFPHRASTGNNHNASTSQISFNQTYMQQSREKQLTLRNNQLASQQFGNSNSALGSYNPYVQIAEGDGDSKFTQLPQIQGSMSITQNINLSNGNNNNNGINSTTNNNNQTLTDYGNMRVSLQNNYQLQDPLDSSFQQKQSTHQFNLQ